MSYHNMVLQAYHDVQMTRIECDPRQGDILAICSGVCRGRRFYLQTSRFRNTLLSVLDAGTIKRLCLQPIKLEILHEIEFPGNSIDRLVFVEEGMASMTTTFKDGSQVEVATFGYESVIGISALMGTKLSLNRIYTQIPGYGYFCPMEAASREFHSCGDFQALALQCVQVQLDLSSQLSACNVKHSVEQRLSRWLLICSDRANSLTFTMSHELLADMLGSTRPTVTLAAGILKRRNLINYSRGAVKILDVVGLEKRACECYRTVKDHRDNKAEFEGMVPA